MAFDKAALFAQYVKPITTPYNFAGVDCFILHWTERQRAEWTSLSRNCNDDAILRCTMVLSSLVDADYKVLFDANDLESLKNLPSNIVGAAFNLILEIQKDPDEADAAIVKKTSESIPT